MTRYSARTALRHAFFKDLTNNNYSYNSNSTQASNICTPINNQNHDSNGANNNEPKGISIPNNVLLLNNHRLKNISKVTPPAENDLNSNNRSSFLSDDNSEKIDKVHIGIDKENCNNIITDDDASIYIEKGKDKLDQWVGDKDKDSIWVKEASITKENATTINDKKSSNENNDDNSIKEKNYSKKRKNINDAVKRYVDEENNNIIDEVIHDNRRRSKRLLK
jgi:hypothetical protein